LCALGRQSEGLLALAITKGGQKANYANLPVDNRAPTRLIRQLISGVH
jgi:hypothetical protein